MISPHMTLEEFKAVWGLKHRITLVLSAMMVVVAWCGYWWEVISVPGVLCGMIYAVYMTWREVRNFRLSLDWENQPQEVQIALMEILRGFFAIPGIRPLCRFLADLASDIDEKNSP